MARLTAANRKEIREGADNIAFVAAELYSSLLAARSPDIAGRGIVNFDKNQAFELVKALLYETAKERGL